MLYGMFGAALLVVLPTILVAYWPVADPPEVVDVYDPPDTIVIDWTQIGEVILDDVPVVPTQPGGGGGPSDGSAGLFEDVIMVGDEILIDESELTGRDRGTGIGPDDYDDDFFGIPGSGRTAFVLDTSVYVNQFAVDRPPVLVHMDLPEYPANAERLEIEGKVILHVLVGLAGEALDVRIEAESPKGMGFGENAAKEARRATFGPAIHNSQAVKCWVAFPVVFELDDR
jgi:TonB family protein